MFNQTRKYPVGIQTFSRLKEKGYVYRQNRLDVLEETLETHLFQSSGKIWWIDS
jgi:hypothetical protein